ncbi:MAG: DUF4097 family beta strand repeat protein [Eubacterium sp.]|nr:DUF4097 family beta strand repeat protein [Eubacterium sp.]
MRKTIYLIIITLATVACIILGAFHFIGGFADGLFGGLFSKGSAVSEVLFDDGASEGITSIRMEGEVMEVNLQTGDKFQISYKGNKDLKPEIQEEDGALTIIQKGKAGRHWFGINNNRCDLTVVVPADQELEQLSCNMNVGDLNFSGVKCAKTDLTADVGDLDISSMELGESRIHMNTGDLDVKNCTFSALDISNNAGDVEVKTIDPAESYSLDLKTDIGDVEISGRDVGKSYMQDADGPKITIRNNVGDIEVSRG